MELIIPAGLAILIILIKSFIKIGEDEGNLPEVIVNVKNCEAGDRQVRSTLIDCNFFWRHTDDCGLDVAGSRSQ